MFSVLSERNLNLKVTSILSFANAFNLDQSIILLFGNELNTAFSNERISLRIGRKKCKERKKSLLPAFSPYPTMFPKTLFLTAVKTHTGSINDSP